MEQNYSEGVHWLEKASAQGSLSADYDLGRAYLWGWGVRPDFDKAVKLLERAQGEFPDAKKLLAEITSNPYHKSDVDSLIKGHRDNAARFDRDFARRRFVDMLPFHDAQEVLFRKGTFLIRFDNPMARNRIMCEVENKDDTEQVANWNSGDEVEVNGVIIDATLDELRLRPCFLKK